MYVHISNECRLLPDVVVTCDLSDYRNNATLIHSPHLVIEVLSPSTERIDHSTKFDAYRRLPSVQEYMLIHQKQVKVEVYRKAADWQPVIFRAGDEVELASLDIFFFVGDLYAALV
jgi:Uma2 family endonuclease